MAAQDGHFVISFHLARVLPRWVFGNVPSGWALGDPMDLTFGKQPHNYGKSPCLMGKSTMSMAIFNSYVKLPEGMIFQKQWRDHEDFMRLVLFYRGVKEETHHFNLGDTIDKMIQ